jgi:TonB family protein
MCADLLKRVVPFVITLFLGLFIGSFLSDERIGQNNSLTENGFQRSLIKTEAQSLDFHSDRPLKIKSKPRPKYTEAARRNNVSGTVRLVVTFSASGKVTKVKPLTSLPDGLTEEAVNAAKNIEFEPSKRNGNPISTVKPVEYKFSIY